MGFVRLVTFWAFFSLYTIYKYYLLKNIFAKYFLDPKVFMTEYAYIILIPQFFYVYSTQILHRLKDINYFELTNYFMVL